VEAAAFPGRFPYREPWSPTGKILLFNDHDGLRAFDADHAESPPVLVISGRAGYVAWSPEGRWVVGHQRPDRWTERLVVAPITGGEETEIYWGSDASWFLWGSNGYIYSWEKRELRRFAPPSAWSEENPGPFSVRDQFTTVPRERDGPTEPISEPAIFRAFEDHEEIIPIPAPEPVHFFFILDEFTSNRMLLCYVQPQGRSGYRAVIDARGTVHRRFHQECVSLPGGTVRFSYTPSSVHSNGRYFAGTSMVEDGHVVYEADLLLSDLRGTWIVPIKESVDAWDVHLSREGDWLAYEGLDDGLIHVGTLEVIRPD
jgi:hypothetical protein